MQLIKVSLRLNIMSFPVTITMYRLFFFLFQMMHTFQFLIASDVLQSHSQRRLVEDSGFISIDCGFAIGEYYSNGLLYTSDEKYISSGKNFEISSSYAKSDPQDFYTTLRSFPDGRRNCYTLWPLKPNNKYLIRAQFMYGNYDGLNVIPGFDVYVGVNFWFTIALRGPSQKLFSEIIHVATSESIDICLVNTGHGTPFISILELRPLGNSSYPASPHFSLILNVREDVGSVDSKPGYDKVSDDTYDRLWIASFPRPTDCNVIETNKSIEASQVNPYKIPSSVLSTAYEAIKNRADNAHTYGLTNTPTTQVYVYWYFAELELLGSNDTREFNIFVHNDPGYKFGPITPKYLQLTTIASPRISLNGFEGLKLTLAKTNASNLSPILNAFEVYTVLELPVLPTNQEDVDAVITIKDKYVVPRIWQGDPCLPKNYQWDGLNCTYDGNNSPKISSLSLSWSNLTGELPPSLIKLTSLKYLNLSYNGFTGKIPEFLAYMPSLHVIDLTGNNLTGPVPHELVEKARNKSIDLRLQGNLDACKSYPCEEKMKVDNKRHHFIIPVVTCVALFSLLVIIGIIFLALKRTKKQEGLVDRTIKSRNKQFNFSDIVRITDNFKKVLGKGGFGTVYYGVLQDGTQVAIKVLNNTSSTITLKQFCAEAELLTRIHHVNLVTLIGYCDEHTNMALVYEFMSCGNLQMHLSERNEHPLSWKARLQISIDAAQGLEYLHSGCRPPIIHRDIKPANILLDEMGHAKIADFGLSRFYTTNSQGFVASTGLAGTQGYLDPEYCEMINALSEKSDVYAFGIVLLQILTGKPALIKNNNEGSEPIHIDHWVLPMVESGDILAIVDKRLEGYMNANSAWKFLEIAMECVKPIGNQRPRMSEVVADLKLCFASEGFGEQSNPNSASSGNYSMNLSQALENKSLVSLPDPR